MLCDARMRSPGRYWRSTNQRRASRTSAATCRCCCPVISKPPACATAAVAWPPKAAASNRHPERHRHAHRQPAKEPIMSPTFAQDGKPDPGLELLPWKQSRRSPGAVCRIRRQMGCPASNWSEVQTLHPATSTLAWVLRTYPGGGVSPFTPDGRPPGHAHSPPICGARARQTSRSRAPRPTAPTAPRPTLDVMVSSASGRGHRALVGQCAQAPARIRARPLADRGAGHRPWSVRTGRPGGVDLDGHDCDGAGDGVLVHGWGSVREAGRAPAESA